MLFVGERGAALAMQLFENLVHPFLFGRLADHAALAAKTNGNLIDLTRPLEKDTDLRILTDKDPEALEVYRHSSAHLLAAAVLELFPETKLGHGPFTET